MIRWRTRTAGQVRGYADEHTQQAPLSQISRTLNIVYLWLGVAIVQIGKGSLPNYLLTSQLLERGPLDVRILPVQHTAVQDGARVGLLVAYTRMKVDTAG